MKDFSIVVVKNSESADLLESFANRKVFTSVVDALQYLEQDPADVLVTDYDMPEMNGMDLVEAIRDIDADRDHYTWILMTGDGQTEYPESDIAADSVIQNPDPELIRNAVITGSRTAARLNALMNRIKHLEQRCEDLERRQLLDPVTGLGNRRYAEQILQDTIRQVESRGGAVCFLSLVLLDYDNVVSTYDQRIADTLVSAVADRIQHLVRPLDVVSYFARGEFAMIMIQPSIEQCTAECYQRIADSVSLKSYKTPAGFLETRIAMSICAATAETGAPDPDVIIHTAQDNIKESARTGKVVVKHLTSGL